MTPSQETSFFSNFSIRHLVEGNKSAAKFGCDTKGAGGGADFNRIWSAGSGGRSFDSHKSDSFTCRVSTGTFDQTDLLSTLKLDVERALHDSGAQITDRGSSGSADFYFAYVAKRVRGRVQISGQRVGSDYYNVRADLEEANN